MNKYEITMNRIDKGHITYTLVDETNKVTTVERVNLHDFEELLSIFARAKDMYLKINDEDTARIMTLVEKKVNTAAAVRAALLDLVKNSWGA